MSLVESIQVLKEDKDVYNVGRDICQLGIHEDAFYVLDIGALVTRQEQWMRMLPRVKPFYAVKCNDHIAVIRTLVALGIGFDCASKAELTKVLGVGVDPSRIIYAQPAKPASHIRYAASVGVHLQTFDNADEMHKIMFVNPQAKLVLRFRCDHKGAKLMLGKKFGCDPLVDGPRLLREARDIGADVVGVSFHGGLSCVEPDNFRRAISFARKLFDVAVNELGYSMRVLDIGGGFTGEKGSSIAEIADVINKALDEMFPSPEVTVIAEPGTYYATSAFTEYALVHSKRVLYTEAGKHIMYYMNDGVFGSFNLCLHQGIYQVPHPKLIYPRNNDVQMISSSVWGPTCDSEDCVNVDIMLPDLEPGVDWLLYDDFGAYSLPLASTFNGSPIPRVHVVVDKKNWLFLRDKPPFTHDSFVTGYTPALLHIGLLDDMSRLSQNLKDGIKKHLCEESFKFGDECLPNNQLPSYRGIS